MQYKFGKDQYLKTLTMANDVLVNHQWDKIYNETKKKKKTENKGSNEEQSGTTLNQKKEITCLCCR